MENNIIFDLDGTLWDTTDEITRIWIGTAKKYHVEIKKENIKSIMGMTKDEIINYLFKKNKEKGNSFILECQDEENIFLRENGGKIYANTINTLKKLYKSDYRLYIVSNCQDGYIEAFLDYYKLNNIFKDYECSGRTGKDKQYNIKLILERNNIKNAVYVGDTYKDYISAKNNNINFIWAKYGFGKIEENVNYINDISEVINHENQNY